MTKLQRFYLKGAYSEDDVCERGLMVALYEINHLNQPWLGSDPDEA